jgi:hypothetical protein
VSLGRACAMLPAAILLWGCSGYPGVRVEPVDEYVGQKRWVQSYSPLSVCETPPQDLSNKDCRSVKTGSFLVLRRVGASPYTSYEIRLSDGKSGYASDTGVLFSQGEGEHEVKVAQKAECDRRGGIAIGMTREQVFASCWGKPQKTNETIGPYGKHEQLVYNSGQYVYVENGIVRSIQTSR